MIGNWITYFYFFIFIIYVHIADTLVKVKNPVLIIKKLV